MPVYTLQGPDGKTYTIEGPAGATAEQLGAFVTSQAKAAPKPEVYDPTEGMSTFEKVAAGGGKAIADTGLGLRQVGARVMDFIDPRQQGLSSLVTGKKTPTRVEEMQAEVADRRAQDAPLMGTKAGFTGNILGNLIATLLPGGAALGAGKLLSKAPAAAELAQALMTGGKAVMAPTSIPTAAAVGAVQGAMQPSVSGDETLSNAGLGAAGGAVVPAGMRAFQVGKAFADPFLESGQRTIIGKAIRNAAGNEASTAARNLREATAPFVGPAPEGQPVRQMMGEIVPGSLPTTGQAAGVPGIAALERTATATDPVAMNEMARRLAQQNEARVASVEGVAGTGGKREFFEANRKATADDLYAQARREGIDPAALTPEAQANIAAFQQRVPDDIMARARELAKINGIDMDNESTVQGMHWVKKAIDGRISTAVMQGDKEMASALTGLQHTLLDGMDQMSPAYGQARRTFAEMSKPINEMQVAQAVLDKSKNPLTENITPAAFARALSDKTAATTTGMKNATLEGTMSPQGLSALERVKEDLGRANFANTAGRGVGSDTVQKLAFSNLLESSGMPTWAQGGAKIFGRGIGAPLQAALGIGYENANKTMAQKLAQALVDPQAAVGLMEAGAVTPQVQALMEALRRGGAGLGAATPALLNAQKQ